MLLHLLSRCKHRYWIRPAKRFQAADCQTPRSLIRAPAPPAGVGAAVTACAMQLQSRPTPSSLQESSLLATLKISRPPSPPNSRSVVASPIGNGLTNQLSAQAMTPLNRRHHHPLRDQVIKSKVSSHPIFRIALTLRRVADRTSKSSRMALGWAARALSASTNRWEQPVYMDLIRLRTVSETVEQRMLMTSPRTGSVCSGGRYERQVLG